MSEKKRFIIKKEEGSELSTKFIVLVDRETGVNYLLAKDGYGAGLTPLLDKDGKPVVTEG